MDFCQEIREEYDRWIAKVAGAPSIPRAGCLTVEDLLKVHFTIADHFLRLGEGIGGIGPRDLDILHSTVFRQHTSLGAVEKYPRGVDKAASLFFGIIKNHTFIDANKRTAVLALIHQLRLSNLGLKASADDLELLALRTAADSLAEFGKEYSRHARGPEPTIAFLAHFIRERFRPVNNLLPVITFKELDRCLRKHGCSLENPKGGYIDVMKQTRWYVLGVVPAGRKKTKVAQIGYPGEHKEVGLKAVKTVLRATGLTADNGFDSAGVLRDHEPVRVLTAKYDKLLRRLADE